MGVSRPIRAVHSPVTPQLTTDRRRGTLQITRDLADPKTRSGLVRDQITLLRRQIPRLRTRPLFIHYARPGNSRDHSSMFGHQPVTQPRREPRASRRQRRGQTLPPRPPKLPHRQWRHRLTTPQHPHHTPQSLRVLPRSLEPARDWASPHVDWALPRVDCASTAPGGASDHALHNGPHVPHHVLSAVHPAQHG